MKLNMDALKQAAALREKGYRLPEYDVEALRRRTAEKPQWVHFGPGNIFRAHIARAHQELLNQGGFDTGIIAYAAKGSETIARAYAPFDNLSIAVSLKAGGGMDKYLVASVAEAHTLGDDGFARAKEIFTSASLMMASFTITEKGYARPSYEKDLPLTPENRGTLLGQIAYLLKLRLEAGGRPMALVSMDNCSHNGDKLKAALLELASGDAALTEYLETKIAFPWTMIDKITPRPDRRVWEMLEKDGFEDMAPVVTPRGTHVAPFVNAEEKEYLVIEDDFPAGRPALEKAGVYFADRETVEKVEKMKVTVCLNPLHTALAVFGCVLGYDAIWKETEDSELAKLIRVIGYDEGLKVAPDPGILSPKTFLDEVVNDRLPNSFLPDTPQRIATDTSHKIAVRFGETIRAYVEKFGTAESLTGIPLTLAGWLRYLQGVDDEGNPFTLSDDPRLETLKKLSPEEIAADEDIFGVNLKKAGLYEKVLALYGEMSQGKGAVRATLKKYLG